MHKCFLMYLSRWSYYRVSTMNFIEANEEEENLIDLTQFSKEEICLGILFALGTLIYMVGVLWLCFHLFIL